MPSIEEIGNAIDLDDEDTVLDFLHEAGDSLRHKDIWTRDRLLFGEESWNTNTAVLTSTHREPCGVVISYIAAQSE